MVGDGFFRKTQKTQIKPCHVIVLATGLAGGSWIIRADHAFLAIHLPCEAGPNPAGVGCW